MRYIPFFSSCSSSLPSKRQQVQQQQQQMQVQPQQQQPREAGNITAKWPHSATTTGMGLGVESLQSPVRIRRSAAAHPTAATAAASRAMATGSRRVPKGDGHRQQRGSAIRAGGNVYIYVFCCLIDAVIDFDGFLAIVVVFSDVFLLWLFFPANVLCRFDLCDAKLQSPVSIRPTDDEPLP